MERYSKDDWLRLSNSAHAAHDGVAEAIAGAIRLCYDPAAMVSAIHPTAVVYPNVHLGDGVCIAEFAIVGTPPLGTVPGELPTVIGDGATVRSHTVIYAGTSIGQRLQTGHGALLREHCQVGDDVSIGSHSVVEHHVTMGNRVRLHSGVFVPEYSLLEDDVWLGPHVALTNALHPRCPLVKRCLRGPRLRRGAMVGANSTILPDIEIGAHALIGAGTVIVEDVPPHAVVVGNPGRILKDIEELRCRYGLIDSPYGSFLAGSPEDE